MTEKNGRDRLIGLLARHPTWAVGFEDETWWSRVAHPALHAWSPTTEPLRLIEQTDPGADPDRKALACYGVLVSTTDAADQMSVRLVDGRPVSALSIPFLDWCCTKLATQRKIVEPARLLTAYELDDRVCEALLFSHENHPSISDHVA